MEIITIVFLIIGLAIGIFIGYLLYRSNYQKGFLESKQESEATIANFNNEITGLKTQLAASNERNNEIIKLEGKTTQLETEIKEKLEELRIMSSRISSLEKELEEVKKQDAEKLDVYQQAEEKMKDAFNAMSSAALQSNNDNFIKSAKALFEQYNHNFESNFDNRKKEIENFVTPLKESLTSFDTFVKDIEKERNKGYGELREQLQSLKESQSQLQTETKNLVTALRKPQVRGRWGEIQLKRVVEMAGMLNYCDFYEQQTFNVEDGANIRPDMIIRLPNDRNIAVDSKVSLEAYLSAIETQNPDEKETFLGNHARQLKEHLKKLSSKSYQNSIGLTPEFTVCFLPGEIYFYAALEKDPSLIEFGVQNNVIIATPTTLISLLKAVAYGWKQEQITKSAYQISELGKELYSRINKFVEHMINIGKGLDNATKNYNMAVGSLEHKVLPQARKFSEMGATKSDELIPDVIEIETSIRELKAD